MVILKERNGERFCDSKDGGVFCCVCGFNYLDCRAAGMRLYLCQCVRVCVCICAVGMWLCQDVPWGKALTPRSPAKAATDSPPHSLTDTHTQWKTRHGPAAELWSPYQRGNDGATSHLTKQSYKFKQTHMTLKTIRSHYKRKKCVYTDVILSSWRGGREWGRLNIGRNIQYALSLNLLQMNPFWEMSRRRNIYRVLNLSYKAEKLFDVHDMQF